MKRKKIYGIFMLVAIAVFLFAGGRILQIYLNYKESQKVYKQMEGFTQKIEAVSYTHLDVYKRQP